MKIDASPRELTLSELREAFRAWSDPFASGDSVTVEGQNYPIRWLLGQLWNCADVLPGHVCRDLGIHPGSTYAMAVRHVAEVL